MENGQWTEQGDTWTNLTVKAQCNLFGFSRMEKIPYIVKSPDRQADFRLSRDFAVTTAKANLDRTHEMTNRGCNGALSFS